MSEKFVVKGGLSIPTGKKLELQGTDVDATAAELNVLNTFGLTGINDTDAMTDASATTLASSESIKAYVDSMNQFTLSDGSNTTSIDANEVLLASDDDAMTITVSDNAIAFALDVDDSSIEKDGTNGLQVKASGITNDMLAGSIANTKLVNDSVTVTAGNGLSGGGEVDLGSSVTLDLDLGEASAADIDNSADSFLFVDADDSDSTKKESIADLVAGMDGTGLTAASGSLSVDASQTQVTELGTITTGEWNATKVDGAYIADDTIDSNHYAAGSIDNEHMAADSVDSDQYVDGSIDTAHIADAQITLAKMADESVDSDQYVDGSIDTAHIADSQITLAKMADESVDSDQYVDGSVDNVHLANDSVTVTAGNGLSGGGEVDLGSSVTLDLDLNEATAEVIDNSADEFLFIDATDSSTKKESIADLVAGMDGTGLTAASGSLSVDASQTQVTELGTITTGEWNATKVSGSYIADDTIDSNHYVDGSIDTAHIADSQITLAKMADESVDSDQYVDGSIDNEHIADATIANTKLVNDSVTVTAGNGLSGGGEVDLGASVTLDLDLSEASAEVIDNSADEFLFIDATDSSTKKESIADLVAGMDGTGLTAASGSLSVDATQAQITGIGTSGQMTTFAGTVNVDEAVTLDTTLGVTGAATFTAEAEFNGGINCDGTLAMEQNEITGTADNMLLRAGSTGDDYSFSGSDQLALQADSGIVLASDVECGGNIVSDTNDTDSLGSSSKRWSAVHSLKMDLQHGRLISFSGTPGSNVSTAVFSFQSTDFKSAKVTMNVQAANGGTDYTAREFLMVCDDNGANPALVEYGVVSTGNSTLGEFDIAINGTAVELKVTNAANMACTGTVQCQE